MSYWLGHYRLIRIRFAAGLSEIQRMIREVDPPRPSTKLTSLGDASTMVAQRRRTEPRTLAREVRGDLDWVVMKCLEKDRTRRYDSAAAIAEEMVRHLGHRPVLAGPPQITYRLKKFTRRHSKPLLATSICAILAAIAVSFYAKTRATARELRDQQATGLFYQAMLDSHSRPDDALKMLHRVTELSPEFLKARIQRAYLFKRENRLDEARSEAEAILADHPETGPAHLLLAQLYSDRDVQKSDFHRAKGMRLSPNDRYYAAMAMGPEDNEAAVVLLSSLLDEDGGHFDARWARGWRYRDMGNYEAMLEDAEFLTDLRSKSATAWNMRGVALSRLLKLDQAEAAYGRAIELAPDYAGTYVNRADLFVRMKRLGDALRDCNRALELEPDFGLALAQRAWVYIRMGDLAVTKADQMGHLERAETDCTYVLERDRGNAFAWHRLGNVHARRGQSEEAYDAFSKALEIRPRLTQALTDRGVVAYELERYEDSLQDHSKAVELDPSDDVALSRKAGTLYRLDRLEEAEANLSKAISLNRENGEGWNDRARIRRSLGRLDEAMLDHNQAVELWPAAQAYAGRGITRRALGDHAGAVQDIQRAIDSTPRQNALSRLWLWEIFSLSGTPGDREKAERQLAEARSVAANDWERLVISAVTGETPSETLLAAADDVGKRLEAFHALGSRALVEGKTDEARRWFQQCVDLKAVHFMEHDLALMHLRSLEAAER